MPDESGVPQETIPVGWSVIVATWQDYPALRRTLANIILQGDKTIPREVLVVGDGFEADAQQVVKEAAEIAVKEGQTVGIGYAHLKTHVGNANYARNAGLRKAKMPWIMFIDSGTAVTHNCFQVLTDAYLNAPDARIITWDMAQLFDPVPVCSSVHNVEALDRTNGLPYVLPGCATAVRTEDAQKENWPDVRASDWAYFSRIWKRLFEVDGKEDITKVNSQVVLIPWVLTIAYGNRTIRKQRELITMEEYTRTGFDKGFDHTMSTLAGDTDGNEHSPVESAAKSVPHTPESGPRILRPVSFEAGSVL